MIDKRTMFGIDPENVRRFLDDCLTPASPQEQGSEQARMEQLLQDQLSEKCPLSRPIRSGSWLIDEVQEKVLLDLSRPVREVLLDDQTSLDTLRDIKDRYRQWAEKASDKRMQRVYTTIYFAAIARALVVHGKMITRLPPSYLIRSFGALADKPWMVPAIRDLCRKAQQACR
jgi:hypothetical protein